MKEMDLNAQLREIEILNASEEKCPDELSKVTLRAMKIKIHEKYNALGWKMMYVPMDFSISPPSTDLFSSIQWRTVLHIVLFQINQSNSSFKFIDQLDSSINQTQVKSHVVVCLGMMDRIYHSFFGFCFCFCYFCLLGVFWVLQSNNFKFLFQKKTNIYIHIFMHPKGQEF